MTSLPAILTLPMLSMVATVDATTVGPGDEVLKEQVTFVSEGVTLSGLLYSPQQVSPEALRPGVVVTGAWTTIKEQMPSTYAIEMARRGFVALAFDFRTWGESGGDTRSLESPAMKIADIDSAVRFLAARPEISKVHGLGICASAGYMATAAESSDLLASIALVAPWLHDQEIVEEVYGGPEGVRQLIELGRDAVAREAQTGKPTLITAAGPAGSDALMAMDSYYTDPQRGLVPEWENTFNLASWEAWLRFDGVRAAPGIRQPILIVHSEAAAIPHGARKFLGGISAPKSQIWLDDVSQFDFYDQPQAVATASEAVAEHFASTREEVPRTLGVTTSPASADVAVVETVLDLLASLVDRGDYTALGRILADELNLDYSSLWGGEAATMGRRDVLSAWSGLLPGFDGTRHVFGDYEAAITADRAVVTGRGVATHWLGEEIWTVVGRYIWTLQRSPKGWLLSGVTMALEEETGDRGLVAVATERAGTAGLPWVIATRNQQTAERFLSLLTAKDMDRFLALWAPSGAQDMPFSPEGFPQRVEGLEALTNHWSGLPGQVGRMDFMDVVSWVDRSDPSRVFLRYRGEIEILATDKVYANDYMSVFEFDREGKITLFQEYYDPIRLQEAWGAALMEGFSLD